jgi:hypothetical protein
MISGVVFTSSSTTDSTAGTTSTGVINAIFGSSTVGVITGTLNEFKGLIRLDILVDEDLEKQKTDN